MDKKIIKEHTIESVNTDTGEIEKKVTFTTRSVDNEPEYIKLYIADMSRWANLPTSTSQILAKLLRYMNYENIIPINACIKDLIAKELNTTKGAIDVQIHKLCAKGLFTRIGTGTYLANPNTFGRGKWTTTNEIRATVIYNADGISFHVDRNTPKQMSIPEFDQEGGNTLDNMYNPQGYGKSST